MLWVCPRSENGDGIQPFVPAIVAAAMLVLVLIDRRESPVLRDASARTPLVNHLRGDRFAGLVRIASVACFGILPAVVGRGRLRRRDQ